MKYDIHNPTPATRAFYDGLTPTQRMYSIPSGETREGIELSDDIAEDLKKRTIGKNKPDADLQLTKSAEQPQPESQNDSPGKVVDQTTRQTKK